MVDDMAKSKGELVKELSALRERVGELEGQVDRAPPEMDSPVLLSEPLKTILDSIEDGAYIVNGDYDIQYVNPVTRKEFGELTGSKCFTHFHDRKDVCPWCQNEKVFAGETVRWQWYARKNRKYYDLLDIPLQNPDGSLSKLEIFYDITELKLQSAKLGERFKELQCLGDISRLIKLPEPAEVLFGKIVERIPGAWLYPDITCAAITFKNHRYTTENFKETEWRLSAPIAAKGFQCGRVDVFYLKKKPIRDEGPFLREERELMVGIAEQLGELIGYRLIYSEEQASAVRLKAAFENAVDGIAIFDADGRYADFNKAFAQFKQFEDRVGDIARLAASPSKPTPRTEGGGMTLPNSRIIALTGRDKIGRHALIEHQDAATQEKRVGSFSVAPIRDSVGSFSGSMVIGRDVTAEKALEESRLESERRFRSLVDNAPDAIFIATRGKFSYVNQACLDLYGARSPADLIGTPVIARFPDDWHGMFREREHVMIRVREKAPLMEERQMKMDGTVISVEATGIPFHYEGHDGVLAFVRDISERKRGEEALRASEEKFRLILDSAAEAIYGVDLDGNCTFINRAGLRMLGYDRADQLRGRNMHLMIHHSHENGRLEEIAECWMFRAFRMGLKVHRYGEVLWRADGTAFPVEIWSYPQTKDGETVGTVVTFLDITDRQTVEKAREKAEERFRLISQVTADVKYSAFVDRDWVYIIDWITGCEEVTGYTDGEVRAVGHWDSLLIDEDRPLYEKRITALPVGESSVVELRLRHKNGETVWVSARTVCVADPEFAGRWRHYGGLLDITEQKITAGEQAALADLLTLINTAGTTRELIRQVVTRLREYLGCTAAAVRLREGENFPYYEINGLSSEFLTGTDFPCDGGPAPGGDGGPLVECMCANVVHRRFDPAQPFFTESGCFWSNSTSELLAATVKTKKRTPMPNCCHGYESVGLFPLHYGGEIFGLLQISDWEKGLFTSRRIAFLERLAMKLSIVLAEHRVKEELHRSEEKFRAIFESSNDAIFILNTDGFLDCNDRALEMFGIGSKAELCRLSPGSLSPPRQPDGRDSRTATIEHIIHTSETGYNRFEWLHRRGDGREFYADVVFTLFSLGKERVVQGTVRDITERKRAEQALRASEERNRMILQTAMDGIMLIDRAGRLLDVNDAYCEMSGYDREKILQLNVAQLTVYDALLEERGKEVMEAGALRFESRHKHKDGRMIDVEVSAQYQQAGGGYFVVFIQDITERKRLEQHRKNAERLESLGVLAGGIAHDFNNILAGIMGFTELTQDRLRDPKLRHYMQQVLAACDRAANLVKQILAYCRQTPQEVSVADVRLIVKEALKLLRSSLPSTIRIRTRLQQDPCYVKCDPSQIYQIIINLCTNAASAMRERGDLLEVSLSSADVSDTRTLTVPLPAPGGYARLTVRDNGCGIPRSIIDKIYDPFFTTKPKGEGTGMGLAVVYGVVTAHGGHISVESVHDEGTVFTILLPLHGEGESSEMYQNEDDQPKGQGTILVADDEAAVGAVIKEQLESLGYTVQTTVDSMEALNLFRKHPQRFDLVITDMTMPKMTGYQLATEMLKIRPDIPIIICTGYSDSLSESDCREIGIRRILIKPVHMGELAGVVREHIRIVEEDG
ncbi:MAG: PAS domain S-box protein [Syntrophales bacterium]|jgi:PAS domain S-box-containing protein|nr:PAS domain S-box protein [Syntrophales bacterium]